MADQFNLRAIQSAVEEENLDWVAADNELTKLSDDERGQYLGVVMSEAERASLEAETQSLAASERSLSAPNVAAPTSVDWRNKGGNFVTDVKNQGGCGSCVSFCTCATIESAVRIKLKNASYAIDLSEGFCQFCGGGSCGGWGLTSGLAFAKSTGVTDEACMPYTAGGGTAMNCTADRCSDWQNRLTKIKDYKGHASMQARKDAIATKGPVLAGMAVYNDFFAYNSGVYVKTNAATLSGYHCICVVGYDDNQNCWIVKNSWGTGWGDNGYVRIRYNQADLLIDSSWSFYTVDVEIGKSWHSNVSVSQVYTTPHSKNAWAYLHGIGWRKIHPNTDAGVTNVLTTMAVARAEGRKVHALADADFIYGAHLT